MRQYHIKNNFTIVSPFPQDVVVNCFYVSNNEVRIITRQVDTLPPLESLTIQINNVDFTIDPRSIINVVTTPFVVVKDDDTDSIHQTIPRVIIQTSEHYAPTNAMYTLVESNPEYEYKFFNDVQRRDFLKNAFSSKILDAYDMLVPGAFRADLFRYAYLFIHGGCYFDDKVIARTSLKSIIKPQDELLLCEDDTEHSYLNSIIMTKPKHFMFLKLLLTACDNIYAKDMSDMLSLTGPKLMYNVFKAFINEGDNLRFKHIVVNNDYSSYKNFLIVDYADRSKLLFHKTTQTALEVFCHDSNHYRQLWNRNEVFYKNKRSIFNLDFYVYPNIYVDTFDFILDREEVTIERSDCAAPWHFWLKLKILNTETSVYEHVDAGMSRIVGLPHTTRLTLPPKVYMSSDLSSITLGNLDVITLTSMKDYVKQSVRETVIYFGITKVEDTYDCQILFIGPDASYHCREKDKRTSVIYMIHSIMKMITANKSNNYTHIKIALDQDSDEVLIHKDRVDIFINNLSKLYRYPIDLNGFLHNYSDNKDIAALYNETIEANKHHIEELNRIIKESGELLEGNVFYEHHCQDFSLNGNFQNKRYNLFYHGMLAVDILEIGFNAGHSALLYLISNSYSKIHFFDLGEHAYSRGCFNYLSRQFPDRMSVTWGDSTLTVPSHPISVFDLIHIDGGHSRYVAESDFYNCRPFANEYTYLIVDDYDGPILTPLCNQFVRYHKVDKLDLLFYTQHHILFRYRL